MNDFTDPNSHNIKCANAEVSGSTPNLNLITTFFTTGLNTCNQFKRDVNNYKL